jgi:hypothetical protein
MTYKLGDEFVSVANIKVRIVKSGASSISLMCLDRNKLWDSKSLTVKDVYNITVKELMRFCITFNLWSCTKKG